MLNESLCFKKKLTYVGPTLLARIKTAQTRAERYNWADILFHKLREELEAILATRTCVSYVGPVLDAILSQHWPYEEGTGDSETKQFSGMGPGESNPPPPTKTPEAKGKNIVEEPPNNVSAKEMEDIRLLNKADKVAKQKRFYDEKIRDQAQQVGAGPSKVTSPTMVTRSKSSTSPVVTLVVTSSPKEPSLTSHSGKGSRKGQAGATEGITITPRQGGLATVTQGDHPAPKFA